MVEVNQIISVEDMRDWSINQALIDKSDKDIEKYIKIVSGKIRTVIDEEQFNNDGEYEYPQDLQLATISLVDNYFTYFVQLKQSAVTGKRTSYTEKIDDYSISESYDNSSAFSFFGIPLDKQTLDVLNRYMESDQYWFWGIHLH